MMGNKGNGLVVVAARWAVTLVRRLGWWGILLVAAALLVRHCYCSAPVNDDRHIKPLIDDPKCPFPNSCLPPGMPDAGSG